MTFFLGASPLLTWQLTPLALPQLIAAVASLFCVGVLWRRRNRAEGAFELLIIQICSAWWAITGALEYCAGTLEMKMFLTQAAYFGVVLAPWALLRFAVAYTEQKRLIPRWLEIIIGSVAFSILALALTNSWTGWLWTGVEPIQLHGWFFAKYVRGPAFGIDFAYCYVLMTFSFLILLRYAWGVGRVFRWQAILTILMVLCPWLTSLAYLLRIGPLPEIDHTPVGFAVGGLFLMWNLLYWRLFDLSPIASHTLFKRMSDPVLVVDSRSRLIEANPAAHALFGLGEEDIGEPLGARLKGWKEIVAVCQGEEEALGDGILRQDGASWSVEVTELTDQKHQLRGRLCVLRDITELSLARDLSHRLAKEAQKANEAKSMFLAHVSHDLRTPIHAIIALSEMLVDEKNPASREFEQLTMIHSAGESLLRLVNDLLDINRIEAGTIDMEDRQFRLSDVLRPVVAFLSAPTRRKGLSLEVEAGSGVEGLRGDPDRLRQVLMNLAGNAIKFTEAGKVTIRALKTEAGWLRLEVEDTGPGVCAEVSDSLFEPFVRASRQRKKEGAGLGLAIVRRFAEAMGGVALMETPKEHGALFAVELPIIDKESPSTMQCDLSSLFIASKEADRAQGAEVAESA